MLDKKSKQMMDLTSQLWNLYQSEDEVPYTGNRMKKSRDSVRRDEVRVDDDENDFRQAIHTLQRIIYTKRLRALERMGFSEMVKQEILRDHPGATDFDIRIKFKETTSETKAKVMKMDSMSGYMFTEDDNEIIASLKQKADLDDDDEECY